jgi:hypothetical protein
MTAFPTLSEHSQNDTIGMTGQKPQRPSRTSEEFKRKSDRRKGITKIQSNNGNDIIMGVGKLSTLFFDVNQVTGSQ